MSHYQSELKVNADPDAVFAYVKDPENMKSYLPTVHEAHDQGEGRVAVDGEAAGHGYHADGWFKTDDAGRSMSWGSDGERKYSGRLDVRAHEDHAHVSVELTFEPDQGQSDIPEERIQQGLDASLRSIKNKVEGTGGKEPVPAD